MMRTVGLFVVLWGYRWTPTAAWVSTPLAVVRSVHHERLTTTLAAVEVEKEQELAAKVATMDLAAAVWTRVATCEPRERDQEVIHLPPGARLPKDLPSGTFYVNGLASCQILGQNGYKRLVHPFEAHGYAKAFYWNSDRPEELRVTAKYVNTPVRVWEQRLQRPLWRGSMSSVADPRTPWGRIRNAMAPTSRPTANLAVRAWQGDVLVTADNAPFYGLDSTTLDTKGPELMQDALRGHKMLAHTRFDKERGRLVAIALAYEAAEQATTLTMFEFDSTTGALVSKRVHKQSPAVVVHDWVMTPNYYIIPAAEARFDLSKLPDLLTGKSTATDLLLMDETAPGSLLLIPRNGGDVLHATLDNGRHGVIFHMGPCHEETDNGVTTLVTRPFVFDRYQFGGEMGFLNLEQRFDPTPWAKSSGGPKLEEWIIQIPPSTNDNNAKQESASRNNDSFVKVPMTGRRLHSVVSDMPTFRHDLDGGQGPCRNVYALAGIRSEPASWFPFNSVCRHDLQTGDTQIWPPQAAAAAAGEKDWDGGGCVRSEPLFVPKKQDSVNGFNGENEEEGFLLSTTHDTDQNTTFLDIYDAQKVDKGPVMSVDLGELWGWNVHSTFVPDKSG